MFQRVSVLSVARIATVRDSSESIRTWIRMFSQLAKHSAQLLTLPAVPLIYATATRSMSVEGVKAMKDRETAAEVRVSEYKETQRLRPCYTFYSHLGATFWCIDVLYSLHIAMRRCGLRCDAGFSVTGAARKLRCTTLQTAVLSTQ